ncbi:hypothetical protein [Dinghuibacter silviterrae]|uniref:Uncharacterized protein n=1 Tax=Dinghuibacter silviterrae TaxID=1539049 RepID=A0A4R8DW90_9BACT|nr:hypothetical protein [Dinghuibacter silviterrae]TDX02336.1 hypothetical protein EDB95_3394 [Dinghuibacter silviterrae]
MKRLTLFACVFLMAAVSQAQLRPKVTCGDITVDLLNGTINGMKPNNGFAEFQKTVPCSTGSDPAGKCGAVIYYKDKDVAFYADRKYFEIGPHFKGKMTLRVLGAPRNILFKYLGNPKVKDALWDAYETQYGTLVLHYTAAGAAGRVKLIQMSTLGTDDLSLCE